MNCRIYISFQRVFLVVLAEWRCVSKDVAKGWSDRKGSDLDIHWQLNTRWGQIVLILPLHPSCHGIKEIGRGGCTQTPWNCHVRRCSVARRKKGTGDLASSIAACFETSLKVPGHTTLMFWSYCSWPKDKLLVESGPDITQATYFQVLTCCAAHF